MSCEIDRLSFHGTRPFGSSLMFLMAGTLFTIRLPDHYFGSTSGYAIHEPIDRGQHVENLAYSGPSPAEFASQCAAYILAISGG